ncbi:hypothetical protein [Nostoc sp. KVJ3]|uniref:hypothetical protein n=1 Tax=Nostoc sp. KVJ3 TaxID=457945 RepID=UPI0022375020|nr:hypothetical protein [Nostoc sp. KVJ3]
MVNQDLTESSHKDEAEITSLVQKVRSQVRDIIQEWCGTMRVLDMSQPIGISQIYTDVNILEKLTAHNVRQLKNSSQNLI